MADVREVAGGQTTDLAAPGPHEVVTSGVDEWATVDDKPVPVLVRRPANAGQQHLPVVVFSHGLRGSRRGYAAVSRRLASHGYAVIHPEFLDSPSSGGDVRGQAALFDPAHWTSRVARVHAVLDSLASQQHLDVALDPTRVVLAGHSFGAFTTQLVLGAQLDVADLDSGWFARHDVLGGVLMSPQGSGDRGLTPRSWDHLRTPLLVVTASRDFGPHGEGVAWRREPYDAAPATCKHLAIAHDGDHHLGGTADPDGAPEPDGGPALRDAVGALVTAFVRGLDGDDAAADWLASGPFPALFHHEHHEFREDRHE